jgi:hypothetical protein
MEASALPGRFDPRKDEGESVYPTQYILDAASLLLGEHCFGLQMAALHYLHNHDWREPTAGWIVSVLLTAAVNGPFASVPPPRTLASSVPVKTLCDAATCLAIHCRSDMLRAAARRAFEEFLSDAERVVSVLETAYRLITSYYDGTPTETLIWRAPATLRLPPFDMLSGRVLAHHNFLLSPDGRLWPYTQADWEETMFPPPVPV